MKTVGDRLEAFAVTGVKPGFTEHEENGQSAFEVLTDASFPDLWKVIYFYPKDFTFVCPTEIVEFDNLVSDFGDRCAIVMGGNGDNEFVKLAWRRDNEQLANLQHWQFADPPGALIEQLGVRDRREGVCLRATFLVDPENIIQHVTVNSLSVGRNPWETLRVLDALQTGKLCPCSRALGGATL